MPFGLTDKQIKKIHIVLEQFPTVKKVVIFGSRAMGNYKRGSDIDLAVMGKSNAKIVGKISGILNDETELLYIFDLLHYESLASKELKEHIDQEGKIFYKKKN